MTYSIHFKPKKYIHDDYFIKNGYQMMCNVQFQHIIKQSLQVPTYTVDRTHYAQDQVLTVLQGVRRLIILWSNSVT